jgi:hypothetical protein
MESKNASTTGFNRRDFMVAAAMSSAMTLVARTAVTSTLGRVQTQEHEREIKMDTITVKDGTQIYYKCNASRFFAQPKGSFPIGGGRA